MGALESIRAAVLGEQRALQQAIEHSGIEVRNPTAATGNVSPYQTMSKTMIREWDSDAAIRLAYYSNVFVYRCVVQCALAISGLPFRAGNDPDKPDIFNTRAPLAVRLGPPPGGPAPRVSPRRLWAWSIAQYLITGVIGWELECVQPGGKGDIVNIWPLVSCALQAVPDFSKSPEYFSGYQYGKPGASNKQMIDLAKDQVFYMWKPAAHDYRQPESPLQAARLDVSVAVMQDRYDYAFLRNDARPAAIVVHEAFALKGEEESFKRAFRGDFRGPENAGKAMFVEATGDNPNGVQGSMDIKILGLSQRDAQFIQRYQQKVDAICLAFGTPQSILGSSTKRTYDTANVDHRNWWEGTLQPLCFELSDEINMQLAPRMGNEVGWWDFSGIKALQSDSRFLALGPSLPNLVGPGKPFTNSELREAVGMPGDRPDDAPGETPPLPPVVATPQVPLPGAPGEGKQTETPPVAKPGAAPGRLPTGAVPAGSRGGAVESRSEARTLEVRRAEYRAVNRAVTDLEVVFASVMRKVFDKQEKSVMSRLQGKRGRRVETRAKADDLFDQEFQDQEVASATEDAFGSVTAAAINAASNKVMTTYTDEEGIDHIFNVKDPKALEFIQARANQLAGNVNESTYGSIKDALEEGASKGLSISDLADLVQGVFQSSDSRAETIARTEVIGAYNGSSQLLGETLPNDVVNGHEWLATQDDRTRPDHQDADGQQVDIEAMFMVGGEEMAYPGDPAGSAGEVINCRCTVVLLTPDEYTSSSGDQSSSSDAAAASDAGGEGERSVDVERRSIESIRYALYDDSDLEALV